MSELPVGCIVDQRFRIDALLGRGSFATVYRAYDQQQSRDVALKILDIAQRALHNDPRFQERFFKEAQAVQRIAHPNVIKVYGLGTAEDGSPYMAQEFLEGRDLFDEIKAGGAMPWERALELMYGALLGLQVAHSLGIVHKDLKPQNLFVQNPGTERERLIVIDYGAARALGDISLSVVGSVVGTPQYLAPEYIRTQSVTPRVDVYQMGLILIEMLTGKPANGGIGDWDCCAHHIDGKLRFPESKTAGPLGEVIRRACSVIPSDRYADASEMARALNVVRKQRSYRRADRQPQTISGWTREALDVDVSFDRQLMQEAWAGVWKPLHVRCLDPSMNSLSPRQVMLLRRSLAIAHLKSAHDALLQAAELEPSADLNKLCEELDHIAGVRKRWQEDS